MSDITIEALKLRRRELELDAVMIRGRVEEISHIIAEMERRRGGRPRKPNGPHGVEQVNSPFQAPPWAGSGHDPKDAAE